MKKLIPMTDFVLLISKQTTNEGNSLVRNFNKIKNYANFLKQPLKLEMFIPCDENHGGVLKKPCDEELEKFKGLQYGDFDCNYTYIFDYNQAKSKVLFEGWDKRIKDIHLFSKEISNKTIEDVMPWDLELTENALKQI